MGRALTIFFGLLAFGLLCFWCFSHSDHIQSEVAANANGALGSAGLGFAKASADGQHIVLTGTAESEAARQAAGRAALDAPGVVEVDNQIALLADVPPPGPDSSPVVVEEEILEDPIVEDLVVEAAPEDAEVEAEPTPVPESIQVVLNSSARSADVTGSALQATLDPDRQSVLEGYLGTALPEWQINSELAPQANVSTGLSVALQQVLPLLTAANTARLDADSRGIRIEAQLATFAERTALQNQLDALAVAPGNVERNLSWLLDSPGPTVDSCQEAFDDLLGNDSIMFTTSKAEIRSSSFALLDKLVDVAGDCDVRIEIAGHTDSRGSLEFNTWLSQERANSVRQYLLSEGVDGDSVTARGFGPDQPIADNDTVNGRQRNRRIEFRVIRTDQ